MRADEGSLGKVPFGTPRAPLPRFVPVPRPSEESRPQLQETASAARNGGLLSGLFGSSKDESEPDVDYETPAFLRNQAD